MSKSDLRDAFREGVYQRDGRMCRMCGLKPAPEQWADFPFPLDAHHITDRHYLPNGGYVLSNGISLCPQCHIWAEQEHITSKPWPGYARSDLYARIGSSYLRAWEDSLQLGVIPPNFWERIKAVESREIDLDQFPNSAAWELACEDIGETHIYVINYGRHRVNA